MRLDVHYSTTYTYAEPVRRVIQLLRVEPKVDPSTGMVVAPAVARTTLMEPMMSARITLPEVHLGKVIGDITAEQGGLVTDVVHQTSSLSAEGSDAAEDAGDIYIPSASNRFEQQSSAASPLAGSGPDQLSCAEPDSPSRRW